MRWWFRTGLLLALGLALEGPPIGAQVVDRERDVTVTGPRGRSIDRSIRTERAPGMIDRQVTVQRPGGTFHSNALIQRAPTFAPPRPGPGPGWHGFHHGGGFGGWGPRPFIGREVIINNGGGVGSWLAPLAIGGGLFGLGMFAGSALATPPPPPPAPVPVPVPVYTVPPPGYVVQPSPAGVYNPAQPYAPGVPAQQPQVAAVDPVVDAVTRLQSHHGNSRRDGAYTLGQLRDPRAVAALVDRLKNDSDVEVRVAAATALGAIGDPRATVYLEQVTLNDKKQKVRDAAALALARMPREAPPAASQPVTSTPVTSTPSLTPVPSSATPAASDPPGLEPVERVPPPPTPAVVGPGFPGNP